MRRALFTTIIILIVAAAASGQNVDTRTPQAQLLIPAAGAQAGSNNTFFRSDITLVNYRGISQRVRLQWLPQDVSGVGLSPVDITINGGSGIASEDFVTTVMQKTGLGAILVTGIDSGGEPDPQALLVATSRIWTPENGSTGTQSQSLPSVIPAIIVSGNVTILGARRDSRYRVNVGIVNLSSTAQTYQVTVGGSFGTNVSQVSVPGMAMTLNGVTGTASTTPLQVQVLNVGTPPRSTSWVAFASSVDNITGDAWTMLGFSVGAPPP